MVTNAWPDELKLKQIESDFEEDEEYYDEDEDEYDDDEYLDDDEYYEDEYENEKDLGDIQVHILQTIPFLKSPILIQ